MVPLPSRCPAHRFPGASQGRRPDHRTVRWYLESLVEGGRQLRRIGVYPLPFRVGRLAGLGLSLSSESVSKEHAELAVRDGSLRVRDLGSKNGTFVNSEQVTESLLREGDILHFAHVEFRVGRLEIEAAQDELLEPATVALGGEPLPERFVEGARELPELLEKRQVSVVFQPIVDAADRDARRLRGLRPRPPPVAAGGASAAVPDRDWHRRPGGAEPALPRDGGRSGADAPALPDAVPEHPSLRARDARARALDRGRA